MKTNEIIIQKGFLSGRQISWGLYRYKQQMPSSIPLGKGKFYPKTILINERNAGQFSEIDHHLTSF